MAKNRVEDMVKIKIVKKNIAPKQMSKDLDMEIKEKMERFTSRPAMKENKHRPRYTLWMVALVSLVFLFFALSYMFSRATITIGPKIQEVTLNENISATKDGGDVPFDLVVISGEEVKKVESTEKKTIEVKAKGTVIIYNAFSTKSQTLNINTQLEGSNGLIYKTDRRLVVPGIGKDGKPGSIEVNIYGAEAGESYNSKPLDFKILGFKGTPKYTKFYARSKGDIAGGVKGQFYAIPEAEKDSIVLGLKEALELKLLKKASEQIPPGFVLFKDAVFLNTGEADTVSYSKDNIVPISLKGTLYGFLFNEKKLTMKIAKDVLDKYDNTDVFIPNIKDLSFTIVNKETLSFSDAKNINITLKGPAKIVWKFDADRFTGDLLNKPKNDFNTILAKYPNVTSANVVLKPFWRMSFPDKTKDIKVIVNYPI
jgi:hypothetical protein